MDIVKGIQVGCESSYAFNNLDRHRHCLMLLGQLHFPFGSIAVIMII